jgi:hypothetical protein
VSRVGVLFRDPAHLLTRSSTAVPCSPLSFFFSRFHVLPIPLVLLVRSLPSVAAFLVPEDRTVAACLEFPPWFPILQDSA